MAAFGVADAGRLVHAGARPSADPAHAFLVELDPALEHIEHLEFKLVLVPAEAAPRAWPSANDMGHGAASCGLGDAEVTILETGSQAADVECGVPGVGRRKFHPLRPLRSSHDYPPKNAPGRPAADRPKTVRLDRPDAN